MAPEAQKPYPLYDTTFTLHRLSPLHLPRDISFDHATLQQFARSFGDILTGDVLRGVRVGLGADEDVLARAGVLQDVRWSFLPDEDLWHSADESTVDTTMSLPSDRGMLLRVNYEKTTYLAIMLRVPDDPETSTINEDFKQFPLLLTRMPGSLRDALTSFLETTFDTNVSPLRLGLPFITMALEKYMSDCSVAEDGELDIAQTNRHMRTIIKDVQVVIGFDLLPTTSLQTIQLLIAREEVPRITQTGRKIAANSHNPESPFMAALGSHLKEHTALDLDHPKVKILKIACGAFVLGAEGKGKFTGLLDDGKDTQGQATRHLISDLVELATGRTLTEKNG